MATHEHGKDLNKDFEAAVRNTSTKPTDDTSTKGIDLTELTPPGFTTINNMIPGSVQSNMGTVMPATATIAPASGPANVPITEQMLAMLNYATMRSLMSITQPVTTPEGILTTHKTVTAPAQAGGGGTAMATQIGVNREEKRDKNKRKFITNSVQIEYVTDSTSGTTPQRSPGTHKDNDKLKEKVSFLRDQLKSLETELKEHDRNTEVNKSPDQYESRSEEPRREFLKRSRRRPTETMFTRDREGHNSDTPIVISS